MKRNIILFGALVITAILALYFYKTKKDVTTNIDRTESNFAIDDVNTIGRILITNKMGDRSDLKRVGDHWTINDAHKARQTTIDHLLKGINLQHLEHIPNKAAAENIITSMAVNGIHVEIFDLGGKELLSYYVGGVTQDERGTFFLKEGRDQPYCLIQPGFEGGLRARYALQPNDWRDVHFWMEDNDSIDTLKVNYPNQRQLSFIIYRDGNDFGVEPMFSTTPRKNGKVSNKIRSYLTSLSQLACEDFINNAGEKDSVLTMTPFLDMSIIYKDKTSSLRFFPAGPPSTSEFSPPIGRYFVDYKGHDFMIGQHEVMKGAFRSYDYFFE
ncbi:MAG: hypothetical protein IPP15_02280 [Saprospiraceae bacterium]|uniref:DUF4340 domain-containing protein n=1 Tax=Candidatus Opimibacter skivensis TaxID=2982028 RepID=A0A9D7SSW6_9BACT|nr:hypothetical protein [Candidatus Opimibacter skivensis]